MNKIIEGNKKDPNFYKNKKIKNFCSPNELEASERGE